MKKDQHFTTFLNYSSWIVLAIPWIIYLSRYIFLLQPSGVQDWMASGTYFDWIGFFIALDISIISFAIVHSLYLILKKSS